MRYKLLIECETTNPDCCIFYENIKIITKEILKQICPRCKTEKDEYQYVVCNYTKVPLCIQCLGELIKPIDWSRPFNTTTFGFLDGEYLVAGTMIEYTGYRKQPYNTIFYKPNIWDARARDYLADKSIFRVYR